METMINMQNWGGGGGEHKEYCGIFWSGQSGSVLRVPSFHQ